MVLVLNKGATKKQIDLLNKKISHIPSAKKLETKYKKPRQMETCL